MNVEEGDQVILYGDWSEYNGKPQFKVEQAAFDLGVDSNGLKNYLANNTVYKFIGEVKAEKMVAKYGEKLGYECKENPESVAKEFSIPIDTVTKIGNDLTNLNALERARIYLSQFNLSAKRIIQLTQKFGPTLIKVIKEDPYRMIGAIPRFGFSAVDTIALGMGTHKRDDRRIQAGVLYSLKQQLEQGRCWMTPVELARNADLLLNIDPEENEEKSPRQLIKQNINELVRKNEVEFVDKKIIVLPWIKKAEQFVYHWVQHKSSAKSNKILLGFKPQQYTNLNKQQLEALELATERELCVVTGAAGTGKTYLIRSILDVFSSNYYNVAVCAPTGKAAMRIEESTGYEAKTIHRLLEWKYGGFTYHRDNKLPYDLIVIDEMSMVDLPLAVNLLEAIEDKTIVVMVGDVNQLPPVGYGQPFRDIVTHELCSVVRLTEVVRQAGIVEQNASGTLKGRYFPTVTDEKPSPWHWIASCTEPDMVSLWLKEKLFKLRDYFGADLHDFQILTPTKKGPAGSYQLNKVMQNLIHQKELSDENPDTNGYVRMGDKIIQTCNNYELGVFNGQTGKVVGRNVKEGWEIQWEDGTVRTYPWAFCDDIELAYAITIHKSQGSEFPYVIFVCHKTHSYMLDKSLIYTALTRAKKGVVILGDQWGYKNAVKKDISRNRRTFISYQQDGVTDE